MCKITKIVDGLLGDTPWSNQEARERVIKVIERMNKHYGIGLDGCEELVDHIFLAVADEFGVDINEMYEDDSGDPDNWPTDWAEDEQVTTEEHSNG